MNNTGPNGRFPSTGTTASKTWPCLNGYNMPRPCQEAPCITPHYPRYAVEPISTPLEDTRQFLYPVECRQVVFLSNVACRDIRNEHVKFRLCPYFKCRTLPPYHPISGLLCSQLPQQSSNVTGECFGVYSTWRSYLSVSKPVSGPQWEEGGSRTCWCDSEFLVAIRLCIGIGRVEGVKGPLKEDWMHTPSNQRGVWSVCPFDEALNVWF